MLPEEAQLKKGALVMESGFISIVGSISPYPWAGLSVQDELIPLSYHIHIPERVKFGNVRTSTNPKRCGQDYVDFNAGGESQ